MKRIVVATWPYALFILSFSLLFSVAMQSIVPLLVAILFILIGGASIYRSHKRDQA